MLVAVVRQVPLLVLLERHPRDRTLRPFLLLLASNHRLSLHSVHLNIFIRDVSAPVRITILYLKFNFTFIIFLSVLVNI
jgi:hypothetical protein